MKQVSFACASSKRALVDKIVERAVALGLCGGDHVYSEKACKMDLIATHANGCPMAFRRLLDFPDFEFAYDICGIAKHMDRTTGKLRGFFRPRSAVRFSAGPLFRGVDAAVERRAS